MLRFDSSAAESLARADVSALPAVAANAATVVLPAQTTAEDPALTPFLDEIIRRLHSLPADLHAEIRRELRGHLESLIAAHEELGMSREAAIVAAMHQFGEPVVIARRFRRSYESTLPVATPWAAMRETSRTLGVGLTIYVILSGILMQGTRYSGASVEVPNGQTSMIVAATLLAIPIATGIWIGRRAPQRAALGAFYGSALVALLSAPLVLIIQQFAGDWLTGNFQTMMSPDNALTCLLLGLPLLCMSAAIASKHKRLQAKDVEPQRAFSRTALTVSFFATLLSYLFQYRFICQVHALDASDTGMLLCVPLWIIARTIAPAWMGWRVGRMRAVTEQEVTRQRAYALLGVAMMLAGSQLARLLFLYFNQANELMYHPSTGLNDSFWFAAVKSLLLTELPVAGIAALLALSRQDVTRRVPTLGGALTLFGFVAVNMLSLWAWFVRFERFHPSPLFSVCQIAFYLYLPLLFALLLWSNRDRLARLTNRITARGLKNDASL